MTTGVTVPLGEIAAFVRGITFKADDVLPVGTLGSVACMRTKNVQTDLDLSDVWGIPERFIGREEQKLRDGDVLVSSANSWNLVGKCCWVPPLPWPATFGGFVSVLRPDTTAVAPRFLYHWFASPRIQGTLRSFGRRTTSISNLDIDRCLGLQLPLPPLPEQRRIAAILDKADDLRAKRRAALAQLEGLAQSVFVEMFGDPVTNPKGWNVSHVGNVADVQGGLQVTTVRKSCPHEVPYLRVANVHRGFLDLTEIKTIRASAAEIARTTLIRDDLLIVEGHGNPEEIGRVALWDGSIVDCVHQNHIIRARFQREHLLPIYACQYLNSQGGRRHLLRAGKTTSGLNTISVSDVRAAPIALPPIKLQRGFFCRVQGVERLARTYRSSQMYLDSLFASLQHRAFAGEL